MKIIDLYSDFWSEFEKRQKVSLESALQKSGELKQLLKMARDWGEDLQNVERWMASPQYKTHHRLAKNFLKKAPQIIKKVEKAFGKALSGELRLSPSLMRFDGYARYDRGHHTVWFGVDHPDADEDYLHVLLAHELSHVYRDHCPGVWGFLKKPLKQISRQEYLDHMSPQEHLASEGLATLFSQSVYPSVPLHVHHYYFPEEMRWCLENFEKIDKALVNCLKGDGNVWSFYEEGRVGPQSPSRVQYFWAAQRIGHWLEEKGLTLVEAHGLSADQFDCFIV